MLRKRKDRICNNYLVMPLFSTVDNVFWFLRQPTPITLHTRQYLHRALLIAVCRLHTVLISIKELADHYLKLSYCLCFTGECCHAELAIFRWLLHFASVIDCLFVCVLDILFRYLRNIWLAYNKKRQDCRTISLICGLRIQFNAWTSITFMYNACFMGDTVTHFLIRKSVANKPPAYGVKSNSVITEI